MKIRPLNKFDYESTMDMMVDFARAAGVKDLDKDSYNRDYARKILLHCQLSGVCPVAEVDGQVVGFILSMKDRDLWIPTIYRLREVAWWVKPEYRNTTAGGRLFSEYCRGADELLDSGAITSYSISKLSGSPDFDYEKRGFKFVESTYIKENI